MPAPHPASERKPAVGTAAVVDPPPPPGPAALLPPALDAPDAAVVAALAGSGPRRVLLVGSSGGHLAQLFALQPWWVSRERRWVTFHTADAEALLRGEEIVWAHHPTTRSVRNLLRNLALAMRVLPRYRPDLVVSTGAGVAFPFFVVSRLFGVRTAFIEVFDRLDSPALTSRLCRPFTDLLCAQWVEQREFMPDAEVIGRLL